MLVVGIAVGKKKTWEEPLSENRLQVWDSSFPGSIRRSPILGESGRLLTGLIFFHTSKMYPLSPTHFTGLAGWAE